MEEPTTRMRSASPIANSAEERISAGANGVANGAADVFVGAGYAMRRTWTSKGLWAIGAACCLCGIPVVLGAALNFGKGAAAGIARVPLPSNAPATMKFGGGTGIILRGVTAGTGALLVGTSESVAKSAVVQLVGDSTSRPQQSMQQVRYQRPSTTTISLPVK